MNLILHSPRDPHQAGYLAERIRALQPTVRLWDCPHPTALGRCLRCCLSPHTVVCLFLDNPDEVAALEPYRGRLRDLRVVATLREMDPDLVRAVQGLRPRFWCPWSHQITLASVVCGLLTPEKRPTPWLLAPAIPH